MFYVITSVKGVRKNCLLFLLELVDIIVIWFLNFILFYLSLVKKFEVVDLYLKLLRNLNVFDILLRVF